MQRLTMCIYFLFCLWTYECQSIAYALPKKNNKKMVVQFNPENVYAILSSELKQKQSSVKKHKGHVFTVVIDPGHGGKDPGALGMNGTKEKDVVLSIARKLATEINRTNMMRAVLTRDHDCFIPLRERLKLARSGKADVFIAIHADAYYSNNKEGASVYAVSERGATSEAARWLAKRDNFSELGQVELDSLKDRSHMLRSVLIDLAQTATIRDSIRLGNKILSAINHISLLHYAQVEQAPFVVLKSPDIPSILVETGFITNPREEKHLNDPRYQQKLAEVLRAGISQYAKQYAAASM